MSIVHPPAPTAPPACPACGQPATLIDERTTEGVVIGSYVDAASHGWMTKWLEVGA